MTRRQALIAAAAAIPGGLLAKEQNKSWAFVLPEQPTPTRVHFMRDCFSELVFDTSEGQIVIPWADVIEALR